MCRIRPLAALLLLLLASCAFPDRPKEESVPPPTLVEDRAGVLSPETAGRMEAEGAVLRDLTGAEITVFTVDFLGGHPIAEAARDRFNERKPGDPAQNNGLLLLLCTGEEDYYLLTGEGLAQALSPELLLEILDDCLEEDFEAGDYDAGAGAVFDRLVREVEQIYGVSVQEELARRAEGSGEEPRDLPFRWLMTPLLLLALSCLMFLLYFRANRRRRRRVV